MKIALCGNPNVGKTTLYNRMTRSDAPVGNWHGVTVDVRTKRMRAEGAELSDLPGAYSLTARTNEEAVTRDEVLYGDHDVIVCVAEVNNLRRNLYLLTQIMEAGKKTALVVNMMDEAKGKIDLDLLSSRLGIPVLGASDRYENPRSAVVSAAREAAEKPAAKVPYAADARVSALSLGICAESANVGLAPTFAALKIMEGDAHVAERIGVKSAAACVGCSGCYAGSADRDLPARLRYAFVDGILDGVIEKKAEHKRTERIDRVVLGRAALPLFLIVMAAVFVITFEVGRPLSDRLSALAAVAAAPVRTADIPEWFSSLLADGVISGVGAVLAFLPQVLLLFLLTAVLQDSGYMSRVAYASDGFFKKFGLSGRAAFSLILGLGCSATAVLSTRGISDPAARRRTAFVTPFCPCSARLAVFTAVTGYFGLSGIVVAALYVLGIAAALATLKVMQIVRPAAEEEKLLMEMPPYRVPSPKRIWSLVYRNVAAFIGRVGSIVLCVSVIVWVLANFSLSYGFTGGGETSILCTLSNLLAPIFVPLGFGSWRAVSALISGIAAKETVVSVIAALGGFDAVFGSVAAAVSFLIFTSLYVPCVATLGAIAQENGVKSALLSVAVHTVVAYAISFLFYRFALMYGADKRLFFTVLPCVAAAVCALAAVFVAVGHKRKRSAACGKT
ncbi:MAG: ferrous iron transport protein B [Roseburia sp.]|nr:ferrous iron transport protein B [Roseburia sp.]